MHLLHRYFFEVDGGKKIRPTMVLAVSYALNKSLDSNINETSYEFASPSQKRLAEITEMIHTASLFHDDVIDKVYAYELYRLHSLCQYVFVFVD